MAIVILCTVCDLVKTKLIKQSLDFAFIIKKRLCVLFKLQFKCRKTAKVLRESPSKYIELHCIILVMWTEVTTIY